LLLFDEIKLKKKLLSNLRKKLNLSLVQKSQFLNDAQCPCVTKKDPSWASRYVPRTRGMHVTFLHALRGSSKESLTSSSLGVQQ
jgi:hypothetical protein